VSGIVLHGEMLRCLPSADLGLCMVNQYTCTGWTLANCVGSCVSLDMWCVQD